MSRILCVIDGMTDPHFQVERYVHLTSMGSVRYVDTCGGLPPETLHRVLRLLGVTNLPVHLRGYVEALGAGIPVRPDDLLLRHAFERLLTKERCMLLWGQSVPAALPPFPQKSAVICGKDLVKGIARLLASEHEIVVASDHGADPESGAHLGGPQPFFTSR